MAAQPDTSHADRVRLTLRVPKRLYQQLAQLAEQDHRSVNNQIVYEVDRAVASKRGVGEPGCTGGAQS
jgi:hypothetical protein